MSKLRSDKNGVALQSRRMFLKSAGGHTLSIPFLTSLLTLKAEKAHAALPFPARFVSILTAHGGVTVPNWLGPRLPTTVTELSPGISARVNNTTSLLQNGGLSPIFDSSFSSLFPQLSLVHGADFLAYFGHNRVIPLGANPSGTNSFPASDQNPIWTSVIGENPSVDHVLAFSNNSIYGTTARPVRRLLNIGDQRTYSWGRARYYSNDPVHPWDYLSSNQGIFTALFGSLPPSGGTTTNPITNLVNEFWPSGRALMSSLSASDRSLLDQLFQLASDTVNSAQSSGGATCSSTAPQGMSDSFPTTTSYRVLADLIAMAFKCDLTRVVTVTLEKDDISGYHDIVHNYNGSTVIRDDMMNIISSTQNQPVVLANNKMIATNLVARLGNNLNVADPLGSGSTILNNSLIYWSHENTIPHDNVSQPIMLLGSVGGRIRSGLVADLSRSNMPISFAGESPSYFNGDLLNRLWPSLFYAFNVPKTEYEVQRGGGNSISLNTGYGHVWPRGNSWGSIDRYTTHLARIGEPWEFLTKPTTNW